MSIDGKVSKQLKKILFFGFVIGFFLSIGIFTPSRVSAQACCPGDCGSTETCVGSGNPCPPNQGTCHVMQCGALGGGSCSTGYHCEGGNCMPNPPGSGICSGGCSGNTPVCCSGTCKESCNNGGGGPGGNCSDVGYMGDTDANGNLIVGNGYTLYTNFSSANHPKWMISVLKESSGSCYNYSTGWQDSSVITGYAQGSSEWYPSTPGDYDIYCGSYGACIGEPDCAGGASVCNGPSATIWVSVVNPIPPPSCTATDSDGNTVPGNQTTENISTTIQNTLGNDVLFAVYDSDSSGNPNDEVDYYPGGSGNGDRDASIQENNDGSWTATATINFSDFPHPYSEFYVDVYPTDLNGDFDWNDNTCGTYFTHSPPSPTCNLSIPATITMNQGGNTTLTANVTGIANGTVTGVNFSTPTGVVSVSPPSDHSSPYSTTISAPTLGTGGTVKVDVMMTGGVVGCIATSNVTVNSVSAWWQVIDGDVATNGILSSNVPSGYYFEMPGGGGYPGIPAYGSGTNLTSSNVSQATHWLAGSYYSTAKLYDSNYFINAMPSGITKNTIPANTEPGTYFGSGSPDPATGIYWYLYDGTTLGNPFTISSSVNLGAKKIILIVKNANLLINGTIHFTKGSGFFMVVSTGNISVASTVGGAGATPGDLEGIFVADGDFNTGTTSANNDKQLWIRGTVAAYGKVDGQGINLQRIMTAVNNATTPAEVFEYAPDLAILFPSQLARYPSNWREVAP